MGYSKTPTTQTKLSCVECGNIAKIWRIDGRQKKRGHIKHMYCYKCMKTTEHIEIKETGESMYEQQSVL